MKKDIRCEKSQHYLPEPEAGSKELLYQNGDSRLPVNASSYCCKASASPYPKLPMKWNSAAARFLQDM